MARVFLLSGKNETPAGLVEPGCGEGKLASHILNWMERHQPELFGRTQYTGIEPSPARRAKAEQNNSRFKQTAIFKPTFDFPPSSIEGIVFSNEFFDALPFDRVIMREGKLYELRVGKNFDEVPVAATPKLKQYFTWLKSKPAEGCKAEAHLTSRDWTHRIARALVRGMALTFDYGHESRELYSDIRPEGTALCHYKHQTSRDFYTRVGKQDITAHINFTVLEKEAIQRGLISDPLTTQSRFLLDHGLDDMVRKVGESADPISRLKLTSAIKSLVHPEGMGGTFKVLVQRKS